MKPIFKTILFISILIFANNCLGSTQDEDKIFYENYKEKVAEKINNNENIADTKNIEGNLRKFDENIKISKKEKNIFNPQTVNSYIPLSNSNFELGHQNWKELNKSYDGTWHNWGLIINSGFGGYDNWYAYLSEDEWLISDYFKIPINTNNIYLEYSAKFVHWGTCSYGLNGVQTFAYDNTTNSIVDMFGFHDAEFDEYDYEYYRYYGNVTNTQAQIGNNLSLEYLVYNDDPECTFALYLDNISLIAEKNEACIDGKCKVYRFQNKNNGTYLFVASESEANSVIYNYGETFKLEGIAYSVPSSGSPMYRFQNKTNGTYLFTGEEEKNSVIANYSNTFKLEGLAFYTQQSAGVPIYRFRNKSDGTYLFVGENEKNSILANYSQTFELEGLAFYGAN